MNAIVPVNVSAIRVNKNDNSNVVGKFQGKTAMFENMPWNNPNSQPPPNLASTGDKIYNALGEINGNPLFSPRNPLGVGVHLQWELPDFFKRGRQPADGSKLIFPAVPNRWLVTRYLSFYDSVNNVYGKITYKSWVVESDFLSPNLIADSKGIYRPAISVPIPNSPTYQVQPYMFMGRVVDYESWNPSAEKASDYLPYYGTAQNPLYLTSIGFVGAYFGSYYPECCSVFGFWDNFSDVPFPGYASLYDALNKNAAVQFRASYQVVGWLNDASADPVSTLATDITAEYDDYLAACAHKEVEPSLTPADFLKKIMDEKFRWNYNDKDTGYELNPDKTIKSLNVPQRSLCQGIAQEVVWNMLTQTGTTYFLRSDVPPGANGSVWNSEVDIAIGNSLEEAVSAMLKYDMGEKTNDPNLLDNYELLLDAVQLGILKELESSPNKLIALEEAIHSLGFSTFPAGYLWMVTAQTDNDDSAPDTGEEVTLPLDLAEKLYLLNQAQKNYDQGRAALNTARRQLFMDWSHYVKMYTSEISDPNITQNAMNNFLLTSNGGELNAVLNQGAAVGIASYITDPISGKVTGMNKPPVGVSATSLAYALYNQYLVVEAAVRNATGMLLQCGKSPSFYLPAEPVVLMQGDMMEPALRNGISKMTFIRLSPEILSQLNLSYAGNNFSVSAGDLQGLPVISNNTPMQADVQSLTGESCFVTPMLSSVVATALAAKGGAGNPAVVSAANFSTSLMYAQGSMSPLEFIPFPGGLPQPPKSENLFSLVNKSTYTPAANATINTSVPQAISFIFSNAANNGWPPNAIGWETQTELPDFTSQGYPLRVDPFLPVFMIWTVKLNPLMWQNQDATGNPVYSPDNLTRFFELDSNGVDYTYEVSGGQAEFPSPVAVEYGNSATMNANSSGVLVFQIQTFIDNNPGDPENQTLETLAKIYSDKKFLSQAVSGFNIQQVLQTLVAQVTVEDLTRGPRDTITTRIAAEAVKNAFDNWYNFSFNAQEPISTGLLAQNNFGPLRAGFMEILAIEIVDAFGQRMDLFTDTQSPSGGLNCIPSFTMAPLPADTANQGKIYLAPRLLSPTRLWMQWLSATFDSSIPGITTEFEEMTGYPATSPVCGWIMPNHLDDSLFFYNDDGSAIGSFGIEHRGTEAKLIYRTRPGNILKNPTSSLAVDIGQPGHPTRNRNLCNYMWYINGQDANFLQAQMMAILNSDAFINPSNYSQDPGLSVLIGRPLALCRAVVGLETPGNYLPLSQADNVPGSPLPQDVNNNRVAYSQRMPYSTAALGSVNFPLRLGDLANLDDGMVGFLIEGTGSNPYSGAVFYAPAADPKFPDPDVKAPTETTLQLQLNAPVIHLTMLVDPRAPVHATTGILPVAEIAIPSAQYSSAINNLAMSFATRPMLKMAQGLVVPLPPEDGYIWSWITPGNPVKTPLETNAATETPVYGYTPQTLQEGWLELKPTPEEGD